MTFIRPKFTTYTHEHKEVINNEYWYNDGPPLLGTSFSKAKTTQRHYQVIGILCRAARRETKPGNDVLASALQGTGRQIGPLQTRLSLWFFGVSAMCKSLSTSQGRWSKKVHQKAGQEPSGESPGDGERHTAMDDIHRRSIGPAGYRSELTDG